MIEFIGVKIALLVDNAVIVILRDNKPGLRYAGMWDLPGGGREDDETPLACINRELQEELSLTIDRASITWEKVYPALHDDKLYAYFMVARMAPDVVNHIQFGDEGQSWKLMKINDFMSDPLVIEPFKERLQDFLKAET